MHKNNNYTANNNVYYDVYIFQLLIYYNSSDTVVSLGFQNISLTFSVVQKFSTFIKPISFKFNVSD